MHPLLARQLRRLGIDEASVPAELLQRVSHTYEEADRDRYTLERAFEISSAEMANLYDQLRVRSETELERKQLELERSLALAEAVRETSLDGVLIVEDGQKVVGYNRRFLELWRIPERLAQQHSDEELLAHVASQLADPKAFFAVVRRYYEQPDLAARDEVRLADGRVFDRYTSPVRTAIAPTRVWSFRDVTDERKLAAERLVLADRLASLGRIAASVGHEINNPLCHVVLTVDALGEQLVGSAGLQQLAQEALAGLDRIQRIVKDLGNLARGPEEQKPLELIALLDAALKVASNEIVHRATLVREIVHHPRVMGTEGRLVQVFLNLLVNAAQAIPEGRASENRIAVRIEAREGWARLIFEDTGVGIEQEHLERIFDPFFSTKTLGAGTGLGLAICKSIVESHGGRISVTSAKGRGSAFLVELPAIAAPAAATDEPAANGARVLVIDDDTNVRVALTRALRGHRVRLCPDVRTAMEAMAEEEFDLILCDLMMPEQTGMDFHQQVSKRWPERVASIVFLTGGAFTERAQQFVATTTNRVVSKPLTLAQLKALLASSPPPVSFVSG